MKLQPNELEFLSAWAREEKTDNPYVLPAHRLQAVHGLRGVTLIRAIKAWARAEGRRDEDIFSICETANPTWPWSSDTEMAERLIGIVEEIHAS